MKRNKLCAALTFINTQMVGLQCIAPKAAMYKEEGTIRTPYFTVAAFTSQMTARHY